MERITIDFGKYTPYIYEKIMSSNLINVEPFLECNGENKMLFLFVSEDKDDVISFVSKAIVDYMINIIEPKIIKEEVELECFDLLEEDIDNIAKRVEHNLFFKDTKESQMYRDNLEESVQAYLKRNNAFNLYGYLNFKFNSRRIEIKEHINIVLENYFQNDISEQFISMLRKMALIQQPLVDYIHVIMLENNDYVIITNKMEKVDVDHSKQILHDYIDDENELINQFCILMAIINTILPNNIVVHTNEQLDPILPQSLAKVFGDRVQICYGCDICEESKF